MFHRFYLLLHSLPIVQFPTRMGGWAKWQILRVKKEGGNPHLVCNSLKFKLITGKVFQWTFLEPAKWWFFTRVFIRAGPIPKNVEILIDWELIQKIFSILENLFFFMIISVRNSNLGFCFFAFKCCVSQLSVERFGKNFEDQVKLGQVKSSPNFCSFGPQRAEKRNIWRPKKTNLNLNSGLWWWPKTILWSFCDTCHGSWDIDISEGVNRDVSYSEGGS